MARVVMLTGGSPWGLTLSGGKDFGSHLQIMKVTPGGKAMQSGIKEKEFILAINNDTTEGMTHHEAQQKIRFTGQTLSLKLSTEKPPKSAVSAPSTPKGDSSSPTTRPKAPPIPVQTSPITQSTTSTTDQHSKTSSKQYQPQFPVQSQVPVHQQPVEKKSAVSSEPPPSASKIVPDSGLYSGQQSTFQSPAFKKITVESPSVLSPRTTPNDPPSTTAPPTDQMKNVVIDSGNVVKTTQRPQPPPNNPTQFTTTTMRLQSNAGPKAQAPPPISRPPPPATSKQQPSNSPSSVGGTTMSAAPQSPLTPTSKISARQGVCEACKQPIRGAYASAMNKVWHPEHFICSNCKKSLSNGTFVFEDEKIFCDQCYESNMAEKCFKCKRPIVGQLVNAANNHYHRSCFTCSKCFTDLTALSGFNMEANELFCGDCFSSMFGATCNGCGNKIAGNELWVEALDQNWHPQCFICEGCKIPLDGQKFYAKFGRPYCGQCC